MVHLKSLILSVFMVLLVSTAVNTQEPQQNKAAQSTLEIDPNLKPKIDWALAQGWYTIEKYLDYFTKPETVNKLAKFQKNYFDALVKQGFTPQQAIELVKGFGNPIVQLK